MRLEDFTTTPRPPVVLAKVTEAGKDPRTEHRPPTPEDLKGHLAGRLALGLIPDKALSLDFDDTPPEKIRPLVGLLKDLGLFPYYGPGTTRGSRLWLFLEEPQEDLEALAKGLLRLAEVFTFRGESFPSGRKPVILPLFGALNGKARPLYTWEGRPVTLPFRPSYTPPEALRKAVLAGELFAVALQRRPQSRHEAALAFLNLSHRLGVLEEAARLFRTKRLWVAWGMEEDGSRTLEVWGDEVDRLKKAAASPDYDRKRGLPYLREQSFNFPPGLLDRLEDWPQVKPLSQLEAPLPPWHKGPVPQELEALAEALAVKLGIDPTPVVLSMLAVVSGLLAHKGMVIAPEPAWEEAPPLWVALVGGPGTGKTPVIRTATRPLWAIEKTLAEENRRNREDYEAALAAWQAVSKKERGPKPQPPAEVRLVVSDTTPEKLASILGHNKGVVVIVDELKGLMVTWKREDRAHARTFFLSAYSGYPVVVDRLGRGTEGRVKSFV